LEDIVKNPAKFEKLKTALLSNLERTCVNINKTEFDTQESRLSRAAREKFADTYSNYNQDLPWLFDAILEAPAEDNLYFPGVKGEEFDRVGPAVRLGPKPHHNAPAAQKKWENYASYLDEDRDESEINGPLLFNHDDLCGQHPQLMHLKFGIAVLTTDHELLKKHVEEYLAEDAKICASLNVCLTTIKYILLRMLWPGRTSLVYSNPRPGRKQHKPPFHQVRVDVANEYFVQVAKEVADEMHISPQTKTMIKILGKKNNGRGKGKGKAAAETKAPFIIITRGVFSTLRDKTLVAFANEIKFGDAWFRGYFQKRTTAGLKLAALEAAKPKTGKGKKKKEQEGPMTDTVPVDLFRNYADINSTVEGEEMEDDDDDNGQDE
jgi:hypothetical protein